MIGEPPKVLKNVFINISDNSLQLVDIYISDKIIDIKPRMKEKIEWSEIKTQAEWKELSGLIEPSKYADDIKVINGRFMYAMPGAIDGNVHFCDVNNKIDGYDKGSLAAIKGGFTTVISNTDFMEKELTGVEETKSYISATENNSYTDFNLWAGIKQVSKKEQREYRKVLKALYDYGVCGFRLRVGKTGEKQSIIKLDDLKDYVVMIRPTGAQISILPVNGEMVEFKEYRSRKMGQKNHISFFKAHDHQTEVSVLTEIINIAVDTRAHIALFGLTTELACDQLKKIRWRDVDVTAGVNYASLEFSQEDLQDDIKSRYLKSIPSVKWSDDKKALWQACKEGIIHYISSNHMGVATELKQVDDYWDALPGFPGIQQTIPYLMDKGMRTGNLSFADINNLLSNNPAKYFKLKEKGNLKRGKDADITLVNLWDSYKLNPQDIESIGKYSPFEDEEFNTSVEGTILRGNLIYDKQNPDSIPPKTGKFVPITK